MIHFALGTAQFGQSYGICNKNGAIEEESAKAILKAAFENNITTFDTANMYGNSETVLGAALKATKPPANTPAIITKYYADADKLDALRTQFAESQNALGAENIYGILIHNADCLLDSKGARIWDALEKLKQDHKISKIGVSVYDPETLQKLVATYPIALVQLPCNMLDQRFLSADIQQLKQRHGLEFHARSLFLQGLLLSPVTALPATFQDNAAPFQKIADYAHTNSLSALELCLLYARALQNAQLIDRWVVGVDSHQHLRELAQTAQSVENMPVMPRAQWQDLATDNLNIIDPRLWRKA